jgi:AraC-like DNA-binding protein
MKSPRSIIRSPALADPLSEVIALLRPTSVFAKAISGAGRWGVRYTPFGQPGFCVMMEGRCLLAVDGQKAIALEAGDFVLLPSTPAFSMTGFEPVTPVPMDSKAAAAKGAEVRYGRRGGPPDMRQLGGYFVFGSPDAELLVSLLPAVVHVRGMERLSLLVQLINDESKERRSGRELVLTRLVEVLLVEALRATPGDSAPPGLLRGLADPRVAMAIRQIHSAPSKPWTVGELAKKTALSRSTFFDRFARAVGMPPMEYLLAWRMALAKGLLRRQELGIEEVAERVGYGSASAFSTAFSRHFGQPPSWYAKQSGAAAAG